MRSGLGGEILRFGVVGGLGFALDAGVLWLAVTAGASPYAGRVLSIALTIVFTWWLNRRLTFRTAARPTWREFRGYVVQSLAGAALNYAIFSGVLWASGGVLLALVLGTGLASAFNFVRYRALLKVAPPEQAQP